MDTSQHELANVEYRRTAHENESMILTLMLAFKISRTAKRKNFKSHQEKLLGASKTKLKVDRATPQLGQSCGAPGRLARAGLAPASYIFCHGDRKSVV